MHYFFAVILLVQRVEGVQFSFPPLKSVGKLMAFAVAGIASLAITEMFINVRSRSVQLSYQSSLYCLTSILH